MEKRDCERHVNKHMKKLVKKESKEYKWDFSDVKFLNKSNFTRHKKVNCWEQKDD